MDLSFVDSPRTVDFPLTVTVRKYLVRDSVCSNTQIDQGKRVRFYFDGAESLLRFLFMVPLDLTLFFTFSRCTSSFPDMTSFTIYQSGWVLRGIK